MATILKAAQVKVYYCNIGMAMTKASAKRRLAYIGYAAPTPQEAKQASDSAKASAISSTYYTDAKADKGPLMVQRFTE